MTSPRMTEDTADLELTEVPSMISLQGTVPASLLQSMARFLEHHPHWDHYRLVQAALAGFLVQQGLHSRAITRCYLANLFPGRAGFH